MNRLLSISILITSCAPAIFAGKWDTAARGVYEISKHPDEALTVVGFLIDLFLMFIPAAIIGGIVTLILKSVFDLDKENTQKTFVLIAGVLLVIFLLVYFLI